MIAAIFILQASKIRGEREFAMNTNTITINSKKAIPGINDVATKCPAAANMWGSKNACSPNEVSAGNNKMAWFVCPDCKQEFKAPVCNVVNSLLHDNTGCPVCAGRKAVFGVNDLATMYPKAAAMWSGKNDYAPSEIPARSSRRAIFACPDCKQEFVTSVHNMTRAIASGVTCCPNCRMRGNTIGAIYKDEYGSPKSVGTTMTMKTAAKPPAPLIMVSTTSPSSSKTGSFCTMLAGISLSVAFFTTVRKPLKNNKKPSDTKLACECECSSYHLPPVGGWSLLFYYKPRMLRGEREKL